MVLEESGCEGPEGQDEVVCMSQIRAHYRQDLSEHGHNIITVKGAHSNFMFF